MGSDQVGSPAQVQILLTAKFPIYLRAFICIFTSTYMRGIKFGYSVCPSVCARRSSQTMCRKRLKFGWMNDLDFYLIPMLYHRDFGKWVFLPNLKKIFFQKLHQIDQKLLFNSFYNNFKKRKKKILIFFFQNWLKTTFKHF